MVSQIEDPIRDVAEQVADSLSHRGYAFVEDDEIEPLATALRAFLEAAGIRVNASGGADAAATPAR